MENGLIIPTSHSTGTLHTVKQLMRKHNDKYVYIGFGQKKKSFLPQCLRRNSKLRNVMKEVFWTWNNILILYFQMTPTSSSLWNVRLWILFLIVFLRDLGSSSNACPMQCLCLSQIQVIFSYLYESIVEEQ